MSSSDALQVVPEDLLLACRQGAAAFLFAQARFDRSQDRHEFREHLYLLFEDHVFLSMVDCCKVLMIVQSGIVQILHLRIRLQIILINRYDLFQDTNFFLYISNCKNLIQRLRAIEHPAIQPEEDDDIDIEYMMMQSEFSKQG